MADPQGAHHLHDFRPGLHHGHGGHRGSAGLRVHQAGVRPLRLRFNRLGSGPRTERGTMITGPGCMPQLDSTQHKGPAKERSDSAGRKRNVSESELPQGEPSAAETAEPGGPSDVELARLALGGSTEEVEQGTPDSNGVLAAEAEALDEAAAAEEDTAVDPITQFKSDLRTLPGDWYVVHSYAGYENRVRTNLESRTQSLNMQEFIFQIEVPTHEVIE